jgi:hypothetical protein
MSMQQITHPVMASFLLFVSNPVNANMKPVIVHKAIIVRVIG